MSDDHASIEAFKFLSMLRDMTHPYDDKDQWTSHVQSVLRRGAQLQLQARLEVSSKRQRNEQEKQRREPKPGERRWSTAMSSAVQSIACRLPRWMRVKNKNKKESALASPALPPAPTKAMDEQSEKVVNDNADDSYDLIGRVVEVHDRMELDVEKDDDRMVFQNEVEANTVLLSLEETKKYVEIPAESSLYQLLQSKIRIDDILGDCNALHIAVIQKNLPLLRLLLQAIEEPGVLSVEEQHSIKEMHCSASQTTVMHLAIMNFLRNDQDSNIGDDDDDDVSDSYEILELLTKHCFDVDASAGGSGLTPLMMIVTNSECIPTRVVDMLLNAGADVNAQSSNGSTVLHLCKDVDLASRFMNCDISALISHQQHDNGQTALHIACADGNIEMTRLLLENGADVLTADMDNKLPHQIAHDAGHLDLENIILETSADMLQILEMREVQTPNIIESVDVSISQNDFENDKTLSHTDEWVYIEEEEAVWADPLTVVSESSYHKQMDSRANNIPDLMGLIQYHGYKVERHSCETEDGFVLRMFRIPHSKEEYKQLQNPSTTKEEREEIHTRQKPVVFLQHGVFNSSATWFVTGPDQSLAYTLADSGFEVWAGNQRGTQFGRLHRKFKDSDIQFWHYSFTEMAKYDLPSQLRYVLNVTKVNKLTYIGHSQGSTQFFACMSTFCPELQERINVMIGLAPVATLKHQTSSVLSMLASLKVDGISSVLFKGEAAPWAMSLSRSIFPMATKVVVQQLWSLILDSNISLEHTETLSHYEPSPTSMRNLNHWTQLVRTGQFTDFDHGIEENMKVYGTSKPPEFDVGKISTSVALFYGEMDYLSNPRDVQDYLIRKLRNKLHSSMLPGYKHNDLVWNQNNQQNLFPRILELVDIVRRTEHGTPYRGLPHADGADHEDNVHHRSGDHANSASSNEGAVADGPVSMEDITWISNAAVATTVASVAMDVHSAQFSLNGGTQCQDIVEEETSP